MRRGCTRRVSATWEETARECPLAALCFPMVLLEKELHGAELQLHGRRSAQLGKECALAIAMPRPLHICLALLLPIPHFRSRGSCLRNGSEGMLHMTRAWGHGTLALSGMTVVVPLPLPHGTDNDDRQQHSLASNSRLQDGSG